MSDYLWDRTGEPDAEVERLETLLSSFGHTPRPLALPEDVAADAPPRARRTGGWRRFVPAPLFEPAWRAAAAALLVTFMLGAGALMRGRLSVDEGRAVSHDARRQQPRPSSHQAPTPARSESPSATMEVATAVRRPESAGVPAKASGAAPFVRDVTRKRADARTDASVRPRLRQAAPEPAAGQAARPGTLEAMSARGGEAAATLLDGTRTLAKEQLIYALRLTGVKLKEVEGKAHGAGDPKRAPGGGVR